MDQQTTSFGENYNFSSFNSDNIGTIKMDPDFMTMIINDNFGVQSSLSPSTSTSFMSQRTTMDLMPLDLSNLCKLEDIDAESPYTIRYKIVDGKTAKFWECKICNKEFTHQYTFMRHLPTHTDERKYQCNICGKAFRQMSTLSQHRAIHSHERPYICEICQKTFNRVSTLISHRKTHTGFKPHQCHLCNKSFHQKGNLRNHIFTHTNERPYKCDDCGKGFNQMSNLMCHKLKTHQTIDRPKYSCQVCGKNFLKRVGLRNHEQHEHGVNKENNEPVNDDNLSNNVIFVDPIKTKAMQLALLSKKTPFALLRPLSGIPVLVKVLPAPCGNKQMLVPANPEDLKKNGQISVIPKVHNDDENDDKSDNDDKNNCNIYGSTVKIKIPVVATVIQQSGEGGHVSMSVVSPAPDEQSQTIEQQGNNMNKFVLNNINQQQNINFIDNGIGQIGMDSHNLSIDSIAGEDVLIIN